MGKDAVDSDLLRLAAGRFASLTGAEYQLLRTASIGEEAPADPNAPENDPANARNWGRDRTIRAALIQWLCFERKARERVHPFGIRAIGARIDGKLDLSFATIPFPLHINACWWPAGIVLRNASLPELSLTKCWVGPLWPEMGASVPPAIMAREVRIRGSLFLDGGFHAEGCVSVKMAEVDGALNCDGGSFRSAEGVAIDAEGAKIDDAVSLQKGFRSNGQVLLKSAEIGGSLMCDGSFQHAKGVALSAEATKIGGAVFLHDKFKSEGEVLLGGADIGGALNCDGGVFRNVKRKRWVSDSANRMALSTYGSKIGGDVFLGNENRCEGQVQLDGAEIRGALNCDGGVFIEKGNGAALSAKGVKIGGDVLFGDKSRCEGGVLLDRAEIGGALRCKGGTFKNAKGEALNANYAKIGRDAMLEFAVKGAISLEGASIAGDLTLYGKRISEASPALAASAILSLQRADIKGALDLLHMPKDAKTTVDLSDASCNVLKKDIPKLTLKQRLMQLLRKLKQKLEGKPNQELMHELELQGFVYRRIESEGDPKAQLKWLREQLRAAKKEGRGEYRPQPYRQFANSLRAHGHDADARKCLISMAKHRRKSADLSWLSRGWQWVLWCTIGNGHAPLRALYCLLLLWAIGFLAFGWGYQKHVLAPSDRFAYDYLTEKNYLPGQYVPFCAPIYAIDTGLPIISLGERDRWYPRAVLTEIPYTEPHGPLYGNVCEASFTRSWDPDGKLIDASTLATSLAVGRWVYIVLGWFFASMLVAGISGLVGRE